MLLRQAGLLSGPTGWKPAGKPLAALPSIDRLQFLARFKAHSLPRRNGNLSPGARIASNAGFARTHVEHTESAQFDAVALSERLLHAFEHGFHSQLRFGLGNAGSIHYFVNDVELDHKRPPGYL